jgi:uncharacterized protein YjbI with pentapeptide repeats
MKIEIKSRFTSSILFSLETESIKLCLEAAVKSGANLARADLADTNLSGANLSDTNLSGANLSGADLSGANLSGADLAGADLSDADLSGANLARADLSRADLSDTNLSRANLSRADLSDADLSGADLSDANLSRANLARADLSDTNLSGANLARADLSGANLARADLARADLARADLSRAENMVKTMGVEVGNYYWKRFDDNLCNNKYQYKVGMNKLRDGEIFADDERVTCSYPGFHFASRSWCAVNYLERPLEAKIRIPEGAKINEPWTTDGKASADMIEILQVWEVATGKDVTDNFR